MGPNCPPLCLCSQNLTRPYAPSNNNFTAASGVHRRLTASTAALFTIGFIFRAYFSPHIPSILPLKQMLMVSVCVIVVPLVLLPSPGRVFAYYYCCQFFCYYFYDFRCSFAYSFHLSLLYCCCFCCIFFRIVVFSFASLLVRCL